VVAFTAVRLLVIWGRKEGEKGNTDLSSWRKMWVWLSTKPGRTTLPRRSMSREDKGEGRSGVVRWWRRTMAPVWVLTRTETFSRKAFWMGSKRREV
jgi:hypothetical protein